MVRKSHERKRKYEDSLHPAEIGRKFERLKPVMLDLESEYFPQIENVEAKVKAEVEAAGVPSYEVAQYINVGRECYSIAKRFSQATRDAEAQRVVDKWASRGLDGTLLARACMAGGCDVTPPSPVCYPPCIHGTSLHDATVSKKRLHIVHLESHVCTTAVAYDVKDHYATPIDFSKFDHIKAIYFYAAGQQENPGINTVYIAVYDKTAMAVVAGSELADTLGQWARTQQKSGDIKAGFNLTGERWYCVALKTSVGGKACWYGSGLIIEVEE